jgi:mRNA interferase MazF
MRRGEVWLVDLEPVRGAEADKLRPAVLVSNDAANATAQRLGRGVLTVVPVTSNITRIYPFQVRVTAGEGGLPTESKAQAEQVRSIAAERFQARLGRLSTTVLSAIDDALRLHLQL